MLPILFLALFALFTGVTLPPLDHDPTGLSGMFFLLRRLSGAGLEPFSTYWMAAWSYSSGGDPTCLPCAHSYYVKFSWGFVYPILATAYAVIAEILRRILPADTNYLEIIVRAGSGALICQWMAVVAAVSWAVYRFRDPVLRVNVAAAGSVMALGDYVVQNNLAVFNGHRLLRHLHDGYIYAMTLPAARGTVSVLLGFYLAARLLRAEGGRRWLIPLSMVFHLPVATMGAALLLGAEVIVCAVRRRWTGDLRMLGACTGVGLLATNTIGSAGYPAANAGVLPGAVLWTVVQHALAHPAPLWVLPAAAAALCLAVGLGVVGRPQGEAGGQALLVMSGLALLGAVQCATGQAVNAGLLAWHNNPSVHSLLYVFAYSSSAVLLGVSMWLFVRGGEWVSRRVKGQAPACLATAVVASVAWLMLFAGVRMTSTSVVSLQLLPRRPIGEVWLHLAKPAHWFKTVYAPYASAYATDMLSPPSLTFADRRFWLGKGWWFNASVSLRSFHQWAVLGPIVGAPELVPYQAESGQEQVQEQPVEKQRRFPERGQL